MWTDYQRHRQSHNSPGFVQSVFTDGIVFSLLHAGFFSPALRRKSFRSPLYMCETDYPISITHFQDLDLRFSSLLIGSSMSSI